MVAANVTRSRLVIVFARSPAEEGRAKRFQRASGRAGVERLHRRLLQKTLRTAAAAGAGVRLVTTGELAEARRLAEPIVPPERLELAAQGEGTLGRRLSRAVEGAFADGHAQVVVIGSDTPELCPGDLAQAFARLDDDRASAVLGPSCDGGFYLLGLNRRSDAAFDDRFLGHAEAARAAGSSLRALGFAVSELATRADLDTVEDLERAAATLRDAVLRSLILSILTARRAQPTSIAPARSVDRRRAAEPRGPPPSSF